MARVPHRRALQATSPPGGPRRGPPGSLLGTMSGGAPAGGVRLRQAVLAAGDLEVVAGGLRETLGLGEPFRDPGVGLFGLANTVFALGDCFLEVVSPTQPDTAAGRYLQRHGGDAGYMVMFDLEDLDGARARAGAMGIRTVWEMDLPDISGTHLHPADMTAAIVSIDSSRPYGTWRWGGPDWTGKTGSGAPGRLAGVTLAVSDPEATAARWGGVLGVPVDADGGTQLLMGGSRVAFEHTADATSEGLTEIAVELPDGLPGGASEAEVGGVRLRDAAS